MSDDDLRLRIGAVTDGHSHEECIEAFGSLLGQAIADMAPTASDAKRAVHKVADAIARDVEKNWHLVTARRARG